MNCLPFVDPDPFGGVASTSLAEIRPEPTRTKIIIFPRGLTDTNFGQLQDGLQDESEGAALLFAAGIGFGQSRGGPAPHCAAGSALYFVGGGNLGGYTSGYEGP